MLRLNLIPVLPARFMRKVRIEASGCWIWIGGKSSSPKYPAHEYGRFSADGLRTGVTIAHRYSFERVNGKIPEEMELDHSCKVKLCVNPQHLELVTHAENCKRRVRSGPLPGTKMRRAS